MSESSDRRDQDAGAGRSSAEEARQARRRFLKATGAIALAVPVIESVTGKDLLTVSAQAQTIAFQGVNGPFTGVVFPAVT